jgi:hypothetical protein
MTFGMSRALAALLLLPLASGALARPVRLSCAGQEAPGSVTITLNEDAGTASLSDDDGLGKASDLPASFSRTEVRFHYGKNERFSIDWVVDRTDLTAAEILSSGKETLITAFLCENVSAKKKSGNGL